jgi:hypothetical protein
MHAAMRTAPPARKPNVGGGTPTATVEQPVPLALSGSTPPAPTCATAGVGARKLKAMSRKGACN